jgi:uncharacterized repeat protein (TIGR02543 family)
MKNIRKRISSVLVAGATVLCLGTGTIGCSTYGLFSGFSIPTAAQGYEDGVSYVNAQGQEKLAENYTVVKTSMTELNGGWYVVNKKMTIDGTLHITGDTFLIITDGSRLTVKGGIQVDRDVKFNVYTQFGGTGILMAGTSTGNDVTAKSGSVGIGGPGAKINLVGGNIYARGGSNAYGIEGSDIHLYWTNSTDTIYASSYSTDVYLLKPFSKKSGGTIYSNKVSPSTISGTTLYTVKSIDADTTELNDGIYAVTGNVKVYDRMTVSGTATIYVNNGCTLTAEEGITVARNAQLTINAKGGTIYAGTRNGSSYTADPNNAGIGSGQNDRTGTIIIESGTVYANGGNNASGIGGANAEIQINGGTVYTNGGNNGAGIGGSGASVIVSGGTVKAVGGSYGAGIGSGYSDNGSSVKIVGGNVTAKGGSNASGIGSGYRSSRSAITLSYTNYSDSVTASSYSDNVSFLKTMYTSDGQKATTSNINGKTLSAAPSAYTVTFNSNGGTYINSVTVEANGYINYLPTPSRTGYTFGGWYTDKNLYYEFTNRTRVTDNITLYAKWISSSHTVTFVTNNGKRINPVQVEDGGYLSQFQDPTRSGYIFNGWYTDPNFRYEFNFRTTRVYTDLTLYADWIADQTYWVVTFDAGAGRFPSGDKTWTNQVKDGSSVYGSMPFNNPTYSYGGTAYEFDGWFYDAAGNRPYSGEAIYSNTTLYASYHAISTTYTLTFDAGQGGQFGNGNRYVYLTVDEGDVTYGPTSDPFILGGSFLGFYSTSTGAQFVSGSRVYSNETYEARYQQVVQQGTIHFVYDYAEDYSVQITDDIGTSVPANALAVLYKAGHNYDGWYYDNNYSSPVYDSVYLGSSDVYLYARVIENPYEGGSTFNGGLIAAIAGGVVLVGGGVAAGVIVNKKKNK